MGNGFGFGFGIGIPSKSDGGQGRGAEEQTTQPQDEAMICKSNGRDEWRGSENEDKHEIKARVEETYQLYCFIKNVGPLSLFPYL